MEDAAAYDVEGEMRRRSRLDEIEIMAKFSACEPIDRKDFAGHRILKTRFVDTNDKSRLVAKEYHTGGRVLRESCDDEHRPLGGHCVVPAAALQDDAGFAQGLSSLDRG